MFEEKKHKQNFCSRQEPNKVKSSIFMFGKWNVFFLCELNTSYWKLALHNMKKKIVSFSYFTVISK